MSNIIPMNYDGLRIRFNDEGWINATDVAAKFKKEMNDWLQQYETIEYMCALSKRIFSNSDSEQELHKIKGLKVRNASTRAKILRIAKGTGLVRTKAGVNGGTWLHPKMAVRLARWLDVNFEIWCDEQVHAIINGSIHHIDDERIKAIFLLNDPSSWEKRFNDPLYDALFRMTGLPRHRPNRKPMIFSLISANWIYKPVLPPDVYAEVKSRLKKGDKIHQHLKPDALTLVERQIIAVTSIANGCSDYRDFEARCMAAFPVKGQMKLLYAAA
ncbi:TPA: DNA-binding protein [Raoultella ornithinolytica]|nr:DNA-binding protein [Raoultella ornithinolytica]